MTVGDYAAASTYFRGALRLAHEHGNRWDEGMAHLFLGMVAFVEGNYTLASDLTELALNTFHDIGDPTFEAWALAGFGRLADSVGDYAQARDWLDQSLHLSQEVAGVGGPVLRTACFTHWYCIIWAIDEQLASLPNRAGGLPSRLVTVRAKPMPG